ncbi:MAG: hypothetical protein R3C32_09180 [Chloroflexota bacterium]
MAPSLVRLRNLSSSGSRWSSGPARPSSSDDFQQLGSGHGGYNEDHEFLAIGTST